MNVSGKNRPPLPEAVVEDAIVVVARRMPTPQLLSLSALLDAAGLRVLEVTLDGDDALNAIEQLAGGSRVVGAGTVMSIGQATDAVAAGAQFLVSPHTDVSLVRWAVDRAVPLLPGAGTATEVAAGWAAGAAAIKLFPANPGGPALLRALRGPFAQVPFVPSGGIEEDDVGAWLGVGAVAVGVGGWLTAHADTDEVARRAAALTTAVVAARGG